MSNCYIMFMKTPDEEKANEVFKFVKEYGVFDVAFEIQENGYELSKKLIQQRVGLKT